MYVWRIPLPLFAALFASTALALVWLGVVDLRRRTEIIVCRGVLLEVAAVATILSPFLVHAITGSELDRLAKLGVYTHHSPYLYLSPAFAIPVLFGLNRLLFPRRGTSAGSRWHLSFWSVAFAFTLLNVANWCSPGWCERFGFPFPYSRWSDAIIVMNGASLTARTSLVALATDISIFIFAVAVLGGAYRRSVTARFQLDGASTRPSGSAPSP